mmetsp:Transcript_7514/g.25730  ORF Transcript_7514/g.25730 Transcript_7514/m.25730 type:complete len:216 (+) Transcript_7514:613-1260(+)
MSCAAAWAPAAVKLRGSVWIVEWTSTDSSLKSSRDADDWSDREKDAAGRKASGGSGATSTWLDTSSWTSATPDARVDVDFSRSDARRSSLMDRSGRSSRSSWAVAARLAPSVSPKTSRSRSRAASGGRAIVSVPGCRSGTRSRSPMSSWPGKARANKLGLTSTGSSTGRPGPGASSRLSFSSTLGSSFRSTCMTNARSAAPTSSSMPMSWSMAMA